MIDRADYLAASAHDVEGGGPRISEPNWQLPQRTTGERGHQVTHDRTSAGFQGRQVPANGAWFGVAGEMQASGRYAASELPTDLDDPVPVPLLVAA